MGLDLGCFRGLWVLEPNFRMATTAGSPYRSRGAQGLALRHGAAGAVPDRRDCGKQGTRRAAWDHRKLFGGFFARLWAKGPHNLGGLY